MEVMLMLVQKKCMLTSVFHLVNDTLMYKITLKSFLMPFFPLFLMVYYSKTDVICSHVYWLEIIRFAFNPTGFLEKKRK